MLLSTLRRKLAAASLTVLITATPAVALTQARADPIGDKQQQAAEIAAQLRGLERDVEGAANQYEAARADLAQLDQQLKAQQAKVDQAQQDQSRAHDALQAYAVNAYVAGGESEALPVIFEASADAAGQRQGYTAAAMGDRQQLIDDLQAAENDASHEVDSLNAAKTKAQRAADDATTQKSKAEAATRQYEALNNQVQGELKVLVEQKQAAEQAAAERAAYAEAQRQAAAQRATVPPPPAGSAGVSVTNRRTSPAPPPPPPAPAGGNPGARAVAAALTKLGRPYVWGAAGPDTFDCSGLTQWAYRQAGVSLPRVTWAQEKAGRSVPVSQIAPGDLVFYDSGGHEAMYIGNGQVVHAPRTGDVVKISSLYMMPVELVVRPY
jgi:cell wall-associated NlpC family hydrolase